LSDEECKQPFSWEAGKKSVEPRAQILLSKKTTPSRRKVEEK